MSQTFFYSAISIVSHLSLYCSTKTADQSGTNSPRMLSLYVLHVICRRCGSAISSKTGFKKFIYKYHIITFFPTTDFLFYIAAIYCLFTCCTFRSMLITGRMTLRKEFGVWPMRFHRYMKNKISFRI
jgi:hypothetical protein